MVSVKEQRFILSFALRVGLRPVTEKKPEQKSKGKCKILALNKMEENPRQNIKWNTIVSKTHYSRDKIEWGIEKKREHESLILLMRFCMAGPPQKWFYLHFVHAIGNAHASQRNNDVLMMSNMFRCTRCQWANQRSSVKPSMKSTPAKRHDKVTIFRHKFRSVPCKQNNPEKQAKERMEKSAEKTSINYAVSVKAVDTFYAYRKFTGKATEWISVRKS